MAKNLYRIRNKAGNGENSDLIIDLDTFKSIECFSKNALFIMRIEYGFNGSANTWFETAEDALAECRNVLSIMGCDTSCVDESFLHDAERAEKLMKERRIREMKA